MVSRRKPYDDIGGPALRVMWAVHQGKRPSPIKGIPKPLETLMTRCWDKEPDKRPSFSRIVPFLKHFMQFFNGQNTPIVYPDKETAGENESPSEVSNSLETHSEPIFPSESSIGLDHVKGPLINTEMSKSDPCVVGNLYEDGMGNITDSSNIAHENSAFTKVSPSKKPSLTSGNDEQTKVEDVPLLAPAPGSGEFVSNSHPDYYDENSSELANTTTNVESKDIPDNFGFERQNELLTNIETLNVCLQDNADQSTSPVSGNVPPHNTPVIGSKKGEINLQDVQMALTRAFSDELEDACDQHLDNGHDYRRSVSADVYHEKDKDHGVKLRHHSDVTLPSLRDDMIYVSGLDPELQPIPPISGCQESVDLFEQHIQLAKSYLELRKEIDRLLKKRDELDLELEKYENEQRSSAKNVEQFSVLTSEQETLKLLRDNLESELQEKMQRFACN